VDEIHGSGHVGVDDAADRVKVLIKEGLPQPAARIGKKRIDWPSINARMKPIDPFNSCEVRVHGLDDHTFATQFIGRLVDLPLVRRDDEVEAMLGALARKLKPDARRCARDDGKFARSIKHERPPCE
jgi:hypothetical protein